MDYMEKYHFWLDSDAFDAETKKELEDISGNDGEIRERFYKDLEFGTGGLRGIIGAGTNRMNKYTVGKATQGLANYILKNAPEGAKMGVAIAYDSRNMSPEFAERSALVLNANGIKAYIFDELRPTPELSYAVRSLGCIAGIVVTASHNPPEYNGYKVYWADGAQVVSPKDKGIIGEVNAITDFSVIKTMDRSEAEAAGLFNVIGKEVDDGFIASIKAQAIRPDEVKKAEDMVIVYTPLHGTGNKPSEGCFPRSDLKTYLSFQSRRSRIRISPQWTIPIPRIQRHSPLPSNWPRRRTPSLSSEPIPTRTESALSSGTKTETMIYSREI